MYVIPFCNTAQEVMQAAPTVSELLDCYIRKCMCYLPSLSSVNYLALRILFEYPVLKIGCLLTVPLELETTATSPTPPTRRNCKQIYSNIQLVMN